MSAYIVPNDATHVLVSVVDFSDGGESEESVLHFGSFESCDAAARLIPAISYSGSRPVKDARVSVFPLHPFCDLCGQRHEHMRACP